MNQWTVAEFDSGLAFFERPTRAGHVGTDAGIYCTSSPRVPLKGDNNPLSGCPPEGAGCPLTIIQLNNPVSSTSLVAASASTPDTLEFHKLHSSKLEREKKIEDRADKGLTLGSQSC
ncbi:hypothetical protein BaRGS_00013147 [Batillaria attramentaria]|uniref:Uncharacterized protein n=1 Tax=Batillaria attramentaria TaxID=370345 RepID=A0ABD0L936_9CAEN